MQRQFNSPREMGQRLLYAASIMMIFVALLILGPMFAFQDDWNAGLAALALGGLGFMIQVHGRRNGDFKELDQSLNVTNDLIVPMPAGDRIERVNVTKLVADYTQEDIKPWERQKLRQRLREILETHPGVYADIAHELPDAEFLCPEQDRSVSR